MRLLILLSLTAALIEATQGLKLENSTRSVNISDTPTDTPRKFNETTGSVSNASLNTTQSIDIGPTFHIAAIIFDPKKSADDALWARHIAKGKHNICLMQTTDASAGFLESDPRNPPSSASKWTGDLRGTYTYLAPDFLC
jgi:hypothetical protein